jgi:hypothetical protein
MEVNKFLDVLTANEKYTELEANKFHFRIIDELFKGILKEVKGSIMILDKKGPVKAGDWYEYQVLDSYFDFLGITEWRVGHLNDDDIRLQIGKLNTAVWDNLEYITNNLPTLEIQIKAINDEQYNNLRENIDELRKFYLN